mgnify:CR=1 FL=1|jgi:hypothetical protein|tara:strand:+ start:479 stop:841 length:363 start_codon:yes stop_codon:yes gene_type:complete
MPSLKPETQPKQWATVVEIKIRCCVNCETEFVHSPGKSSVYCCGECARRVIYEKHKKSWFKTEEHESWPEYEDYRGVQEFFVPQEILESAITNAENPQIVEDTYVTFKKLNQEYRRLNEI